MSDIEAQPETTQFGPFLLDRRRRLLLSGGRPVKIGTMQFDLLAYLIDRREEAPTRDDITAHVWRGLAVGTNSLSVQLSALRRVLAENGGDERLIITLPGQRYRFVGEVEAAGSAEADEQLPAVPPIEALQRQASAIATPTGAYSTRHWLFAGAVALLVLLPATYIWMRPTTGITVTAAPRLSIVVLPFRNLSADRGQDYLASAITDDLTIDLAHIPYSTVIARESADSFAGSKLTAQQIGQQLHVRYLLDGSLRTEGPVNHINCELIDTSTGINLWADSFDQPRDHLTDARDAIVRRIAAALHFQLDSVESARSLHDRPNDPDAIDLFFRARFILDTADSMAGLTAAERLLYQAIKLQPDFADALAEIGWVLSVKIQKFEDPDSGLDWAESRRLIARALELAPRNALAIAARARELSASAKFTEAAYAASTALAIEPSSLAAHWVLANCAWLLGKHDLAESQLQEIARLNPDSQSNSNKNRLLMLADIRLLAGRPKDAIDLLQQAVAGDPEPQPGEETMGRAEIARYLLMAAFELSDGHDAALDLYQHYRKIWPHRSVWRILAQFPKAVTQSPGLLAIGNALRKLGMPAFATADPATAPTCLPGDFTPTPNRLQGATVIDANGLKQQLLLLQPPLVIDLGLGSVSPVGSVWFGADGPPESATDFAERIAGAQARLKTDSAIVVMGNGPFGCDAYAAAQRLVQKGYKHIGWFRGGEEAWAESGNPARDARPE
jgi:TolB-like protein/DNA-binding winged helix-turn-helix (wHTH) protein